MTKILEQRPREPAPRYLAAQLYASAGQSAAAARELEVLASFGWTGGILASDFAGAISDPRVQEAVTRLDEQMHRLVRGLEVAVLDAPELRPEGITLDPQSGTVYLGDLRAGDLYAVEPGGSATRVAEGDGLSAVYGVQVDPTRQRLWAVVNSRSEAPDAGRSGPSRLVGYSLHETPGARLREISAIDLPDGEANDLCLQDEQILVSDSSAKRIYRVVPETATVRTVELGDLTFGINGIACVAGERFVFAAGVLEIIRLDLETGELRVLDKPADLSVGGIDGLYRYGGGLIGIQNAFGFGRVVALRLDAEHREVLGHEVLEIGVPGQHIPTTGAIDGEDFLYIANSQVDRSPEESFEPVILRRLSLPPIPVAR